MSPLIRLGGISPIFLRVQGSLGQLCRRAFQEKKTYKSLPTIDFAVSTVFQDAG